MNRPKELGIGAQKAIYEHGILALGPERSAWRGVYVAESVGLPETPHATAVPVDPADLTGSGPQPTDGFDRVLAGERHGIHVACRAQEPVAMPLVKAWL